MTTLPNPFAGATPLQRALLRLLRVRRLPAPPEEAFSRILAVQIAGMGDFVLAVPALRALRRGFPRARLDLLTSEKGARAAKGCPHLDEVMAFDIQPFLDQGRRPAGRWRELAGLVRKIRARRYEIALNLIGLYSPKGAVRMGMFLRALGVPLLAGRDTRGTGTFFHYALEEPLTSPRNERDANLDLIRLLGVPQRRERGALPLWPPPEGPAEEAEEIISDRLETWPSEEEERTADLLAWRIEGGGPLIGVNPGTDRPEKAWPEENFLHLMRALREERSARFLLLGGPAEADLTGRLARALGEGALDTNGQISFQGTAALMRRMALFLTCDTAALHLAWAAEVPAVALFRRENLGRYRPATAQIRCLVGKEDADSLEIPPPEVLAACRERVEARRTGRG